ncbi:Hsp20/alpha crystallin family protein [Halovivax cerinus]|uniref:Hsp20/alpha crystallin family protein n=1 Tax=Halovivax cerinus TaxID=1487865 RepID=A0ABD5NJY1_9EURY|nr:Hsp20/alpha crystallin family protein [Halovivax cerinus]
MRDRTVPRSIVDLVYRGVGQVTRTIQRVRTLDSDLLETDGSYLLVVDTPGADTAALDIRYLEGQIQVVVDRPRTTDTTYRTRFLGRSTTLAADIALPDDAVVDPETATARLDSLGTVKIELPKETAADEDRPQGEEIPIDD